MTARRVASLLAALGLAACAHTPAPVPSDSAGTLGTLDAAYDRGRWRWVKNPDGRELLAHTNLPKCFVDPKPDAGYNEPGFTAKREQKSFGAARYTVTNVYEGTDFWIAVYQREGAAAPALGVYSEGQCREAAEEIIRSHESRTGPA